MHKKSLQIILQALRGGEWLRKKVTKKFVCLIFFRIFAPDNHLLIWNNETELAIYHRKITVCKA